ncbi:MAG: chaperone NapD [Zoogloeaceae bacterium]|jgi:nitrate reductase NapAB chaperone NapD|nr:chaperone NapD [Zoogloeaceae bacterium]
MKIVSLVLSLQPDHAPEVRRAVEGVPGASVAADPGGGQMIVLLEDTPDCAVSDCILQINDIPHVVCVGLAYEYSDEEALNLEGE